jgi:hypothetical protein
VDRRLTSRCEVCGQEAAGEKGEDEQWHQERLRATHHIVLGTEPNGVDIHAEVVVLGAR